MGCFMYLSVYFDTNTSGKKKKKKKEMVSATAWKAGIIIWEV